VVQPDAIFALVCHHLRLQGCGSAFKLAFEIWLMCPLPLILTNALFTKVQPMIATAYSVGWLVKLVVAAVATVLILG
jgi:hypothetical protein